MKKVACVLIATIIGLATAMLVMFLQEVNRIERQDDDNN